jgi:hypothetical protein
LTIKVFASRSKLEIVVRVKRSGTRQQRAGLVGNRFALPDLQAITDY